MNMPVWSDLLRIGNETIDSSHRDIMAGLAAVHEAVHEHDYPRAERMIDALADACSIHAQSEDEAFAGTDHCFPHETLDDLLLTLRLGVRHRQAPDRMFDTIRALGNTLLSDIHADRWEMARRKDCTPWRNASRRWLNTPIPTPPAPGSALTRG